MWWRRSAKGERTEYGHQAGAVFADLPSHDEAGRPVRITMLGRPGCHLCDDARVVVAHVADDLGVGWAERSVLDAPGLLERYGEQLPVTFVDGRRHDYWRVDEHRLRAALRS